MPKTGKQRAEPAGLGQQLQRWDRNGERRGCRLQRRRKRGENCGDLGAWLAQNLLVAGENCGGRYNRHGSIVTPSGTIWFHRFCQTEEPGKLESSIHMTESNRRAVV